MTASPAPAASTPPIAATEIAATIDAWPRLAPTEMFESSTPIAPCDIVIPENGPVAARRKEVA